MGSFPTPGDLPDQGSNLGLLHCRRILYCLSHQGLTIIWDLDARFDVEFLGGQNKNLLCSVPEFSLFQKKTNDTSILGKAKLVLILRLKEISPRLTW